MSKPNRMSNADVGLEDPELASWNLHLARLGIVPPPCGWCGHNHWQFHGVVGELMMNPDGQVGPAVTPMGVIKCTHCGHAEKFFWMTVVKGDAGLVLPAGALRQ